MASGIVKNDSSRSSAETITVSKAWHPGRSPQPRVCDADASATDRNECLSVQGFAVLLEHFGHQGEAVASGDIGKPYQACMFDSPDVHQFAEVSVDRDQNPALRRGPFEQRPITWIGFELPGIEDVVAPGA